MKFLRHEKHGNRRLHPTDAAAVGDGIRMPHYRALDETSCVIGMKMIMNNDYLMV
ncbi:hypothetical protein [Roseovarius pelagicus]|uniref:Uncharacterized protein n=1 Tax=Roseovarius pelagicus TaxID=2980108 RepID=A0ABY6D8T0_9RHOB|nr:hypothetical protein [Roseovarius pelagicus]UXX82547.1 hypothetical protein N7U68_15815 [Roseovarius pelagicus]